MFNINKADGWIGDTAVFFRKDGTWFVKANGDKLFVKRR